METPKIFDSEYRFACIVWAHEPVTTRELVQLCQEQLEWKRTTTYTVLKRLCERGIFQTENSVVTSRDPQGGDPAGRKPSVCEAHLWGLASRFYCSLSGQ